MKAHEGKQLTPFHNEILSLTNYTGHEKLKLRQDLHAERQSTLELESTKADLSRVLTSMYSRLRVRDEVLGSHHEFAVKEKVRLLHLPCLKIPLGHFSRVQTTILRNTKVNASKSCP